jgi:hypothetical protein
MLPASQGQVHLNNGYMACSTAYMGRGLQATVGSGCQTIPGKYRHVCESKQAHIGRQLGSAHLCYQECYSSPEDPRMPSQSVRAYVTLHSSCGILHLMALASMEQEPCSLISRPRQIDASFGHASLAAAHL